MKDGIIKADGTSRLMRATLPATYEAFRAAAAAGTLPLDVLFNESGWSQQPTFLNKANLLTDSTALLFGLGAEAVPDNAFSLLGKYNQHWWKRTSTETTTVYQEVRTSYGKNLVIASGGYGSVNLVTCSQEITIANGVVSLKNPQNRSYDKIFIPGYVSVSSIIYYIPETSTLLISDDEDNSQITAYFLSGKTQTVTAKSYEVESGETEILRSSDRNAYPDSGEVDGFEYEYLGVPFENAVTAPALEVGSYTGTGATGANNPCVIPLFFEPKFVLVAPINPNFYASNSFISWFFWLPGMTQVNAHGSNKITVSVTEDKFSFYSTSAAYQLNESNKEYRYIILG